MTKLRCPTCGSPLIKTVKPFFFHNYLIGYFDAYVCKKSQSVYRTAEVSEQIENYMKEHHLL